MWLHPYVISFVRSKKLLKTHCDKHKWQIILHPQILFVILMKTVNMPISTNNNMTRVPYDKKVFKKNINIKKNEPTPYWF
jgi:hypothetical protein